MKKLVFLQVIYGILTFSFLGLLILYFFTNLVDWYGWIGWLWTVFAGLMIGAGAKKKELKSILKLCFVAAAQDEKFDNKELEYFKSLSNCFNQLGSLFILELELSLSFLSSFNNLLEYSFLAID